MPDVTVAAVSTFAGVMSAGAVLVAGGGLRPNAAERRARGTSTTPMHHAYVVRARSWLENELDRAGWREGPERVHEGCLTELLNTAG